MKHVIARLALGSILAMAAFSMPLHADGAALYEDGGVAK